MRRRGRKNNDAWAFGLAAFLGVPVFLLMVHPLIFFLLFVPLVIILILAIIGWLKK